jgi:small subunit ribosomal protein S20
LATRSATKAHRQSLKKRLRNRKVQSATKSAVRRAVTSIASGDLDTARNDVRAAISTLDRTSSKGVVHPNNAARRKSRLLLKYNAAVAALQAPVAEAGEQVSKRKPAARRASPKTTAKTRAKKAKR